MGKESSADLENIGEQAGYGGSRCVFDYANLGLARRKEAGYRVGFVAGGVRIDGGERQSPSAGIHRLDLFAARPGDCGGDRVYAAGGEDCGGDRVYTADGGLTVGVGSE